MNHKSITFLVPDMHCPSCPKLITLDLQDINGVIEVNASLETKSVAITYDADITNPQVLINTITNSGYTPKVANA